MWACFQQALMSGRVTEQTGAVTGPRSIRGFVETGAGGSGVGSDGSSGVEGVEGSVGVDGVEGPEGFPGPEGREGESGVSWLPPEGPGCWLAVGEE